MPLLGSPASPRQWRTARKALGLWLACRPQGPWMPKGGWPSTEPHVASLVPDGSASSFGLHRARPADSRTDFSSYCVQQPPRHQRWRRAFGSALASLLCLTSGTGGGGNNAAGWTGRRRDPHEASKGTTTSGIGSALFAGKANTLDAIRAVIRSLITPFCRPSPRLFRLWSKRRRGRSEQRNCERLGFAQRDNFFPCISVELWASQILFLSLRIYCPGK